MFFITQFGQDLRGCWAETREPLGRQEPSPRWLVRVVGPAWEEKKLISVFFFFLGTDLKGFAEELDVGCERKREVGQTQRDLGRYWRSTSRPKIWLDSRILIYLKVSFRYHVSSEQTSATMSNFSLSPATMSSGPRPVPGKCTVRVHYTFPKINRWTRDGQSESGLDTHTQCFSLAKKMQRCRKGTVLQRPLSTLLFL